jgi:N-methylhydantoinase B/oxoprolinase/acetone carboxylase alpha subunit
VTDSEGAGEWRGCMALRLDLRFLAEGTLQMLTQRRAILPYGLAGGKQGSPSANALIRDGKRELLPIITTLHVSQGDVISHEHASGGGWGDPFRRDPDSVVEQILDERLTRERALEAYGVVVREDARGAIVLDEERTNEIRAGRR